MNKPDKKIIDNIISFYNHGNINKAEELTKTQLKDFSDYYFLWKILGAIYLQKKKFNESIIAIKKSISLKSNDHESYFNLAINYENIGNINEAEENYRYAIKINQNYYQAYNNLGLLLSKLDKLNESQVLIEKAIKINSAFSEAYFNLAYIKKRLNKIKDASDNYKKAIDIDSNYYQAYNNLAIILLESGKLEDSIIYFEKAISIKKDFIDAWVNCSEAFEKSNSINLLEKWIRKIPRDLLLKSPDLNFFLAKLLMRKKKSLEAFKVLSNINYEKLNLNRRIDYFNLLGNCLDRLENFDEAFQAFENMNNLLDEIIDINKFDTNIYFQNNFNQLKNLKQNNLISEIKFSKVDDFNPVFLIGFPRSGTTLLDTILSSHSKIEVIEEKPMINSVKAYLINSGFDLNKFENIPRFNLDESRKIYQKQLYKNLSSQLNDSIYIDKLPLNIFNLPLIHKLFPKSKIIVSIRHPLDSILSCWMQNFKLNNAMVNFTKFEKSIDLYCLAMETLEYTKNKYQLNIHYAFYEKLVNDFRKECLGILKFLGIGWEESLYSFWNTALNRKNIKTPSYSQVINPIYDNSLNRWKNYSKFLKKYYLLLEPWIKKYGY